MKWLPVLAGFAFSVSLTAGEKLYNGIVLPDDWPPRPDTFPREKPVTPPYLIEPPMVIPIDLGRQLFVDDFLIEETTLERNFHQPAWHPDSPVLKPETLWEHHRARNIPFAAPFSGGVWHDPKDGLLKMWYMAGSAVTFGYATSTDGIHWERPILNPKRVGGENILTIEPIVRDSSTVWLDPYDKDPARRFKLMYYRAGLQMRTSPDGIEWSESYGAPGHASDRNTFFYNPFRKLWIYSIRAGRRDVGRCRYYGESPRFGVRLWEKIDDLSKWTCADPLDRVKPVEYVDDRPDLYNLDATPYESLMLGLFSIHAKVAEGDRPKINYVTLGYSRDGFHWHRPDRRPFLDVADDKTAWNYGNVQSAGGGCLVMGDQLYFYCSGRNSGRTPDDGSGGSTGLAILRRDGFASMDAGEKSGTLTTRPVTFSGNHLFVNAEFGKGGGLKAEVLNAGTGEVIAPFSMENCQTVSEGGTRVAVLWKDGLDHPGIAKEQPVRIRFQLTRGKLYSFWISSDPSGASNGYVAAGGSGFTSDRDTDGR